MRCKYTDELIDTSQTESYTKYFKDKQSAQSYLKCIKALETNLEKFKDIHPAEVILLDELFLQRGETLCLDV